MATIELLEVEKRFGDFQAVKPLNLTINDGEFVVLLGPSGCGKTTTLRMISGLEAVSGGTILFDGRDVTWLNPSERNIAFVFQFFALYSHMTARQNISFPLEAELGADIDNDLGLGEVGRFLSQRVFQVFMVQWLRRRHRAVINQRVEEVAQLLRIQRLLDRRPGVLSGGDQQRVALARALVREPAAFLMDEPLGALDAEFRETMRAEIKRLHIDQHATTVYVTHDQIEAMAMGDRIVVMSDAEIQQVGTPAEVYHDPANLFVARFIGSPGMSLINGQYNGQGMIRINEGNTYRIPDDWKASIERGLTGDDGEIIIGFRPEAAHVNGDGDLSARVYADDLHGGYSMLHLDLGEDTIVHARAGREMQHEIDEALRFTIDPASVRFFDPRTEAAIRKAT
ncbi:MAG: ABC transporter ATP-binding protein [Chloroflexi bacterium]|nr:ABC transporter ATP-binding protein [Chloroflexota bacterium]